MVGVLGRVVAITTGTAKKPSSAQRVVVPFDRMRISLMWYRSFARPQMLLCCLGLQNLEGGKARAGVLPYTTQFGVTILAATG